MRRGYAKFRRGIVEHLEGHRLTGDEFAVYALLILLADYKTGVWVGSAGQLAGMLGWSRRQCQNLLKSLRTKSYLDGQYHTKGKAYPIRVLRYLRCAPYAQVVEKVRIQRGTGTNTTTTSEEVKEVILKKKAAQVQRGPSPSYRGEEEQRRIVEARDYRLQKEAEARREAQIGAGPVLALPELWAEVSRIAQLKKF